MGFKDELYKIANQTSAADAQRSGANSAAAGFAPQASLAICRAIADATDFLRGRSVRAPMPDRWIDKWPRGQHWMLPRNWTLCADYSFYTWDQYGTPGGLIEVPYMPHTILPIRSSAINSMDYYEGSLDLPETVRFAVDEIGRAHISTFVEYDGMQKWQMTEFEPELLRQIQMLLDGP